MNKKELKRQLDECKEQLQAAKNEIKELQKLVPPDTYRWALPSTIAVSNHESCINPDCDCLDYCEADDPYSDTPTRKI